MEKKMLELRADLPIYTNQLTVYIRWDDDGRKRAFVHELKVVDVEKDGQWPIAFSLESYVASQLFEELWRLGFRPKNGESSLAHVDAMRAHISDLRRIVFKDEL